MKRDAILEVIKSLAMSQGFYGRLLKDIYYADEEVRENFWEHMESLNLKDALDVVLYFES